jgi:hypothetical protein
VWGWAPPFYYHARIPPASRFVVLAQARLTPYVSGNLEAVRGRTPGGQVAPRHWDWLLEDLERSRATYVLDAAPTGLWHWNRYPLREQPRLQGFLDEGYERVDVVENAVLYRRRGCADPARLPAAEGSP